MDLKSYLAESNRTQADLAAAIGVSPSMLSQWLIGHRPIAARWAIPIERATGGKCSRHEIRPDIYPPSEIEAA